MKNIEKYTFGMGDRFRHQGHAQLNAVLQGRSAGIDVYPVWNKSNREHMIIGTQPDSLRAEADEAVKAAGWEGSYYVDADHVGLKTVDGFINASNFFTLDVADFVGTPASETDVNTFRESLKRFNGSVVIPHLGNEIQLTDELINNASAKYLNAIKEAGKIYRHIKEKKSGEFVIEVSIDETDSAQTPDELFLILAMISQEGIPAQTIAPKFTGRFNKGVDYVGDIKAFEREFEADVCIIELAVEVFGLPKSLKLSVHSGSDKFSLYPIINRIIKKYDAGLHVKTAGTTWLEEVGGLAQSGGEGLEIAKEVYAKAYDKFDELTAPYATVIDIDRSQLPTPAEVNSWDADKFYNTLCHEQDCADYNSNVRQLIHVGFKVAAQMGDRYLNALKTNEARVGANVTYNLLERHIKPIFGA